jgi:hypothetical protein
MTTINTKTTRRGFSVVAAGAAIALGAGTGVAFAAIQSGAAFKGQVGRGQFVAYWSPETGTSQVIGIDMPVGTSDANAPIDSGGRGVTLPAGLELFEGQSFVTTNAAVGLAPKGTQPSKNGRAGYVAGLTGTVGKGWKVTLSSGDGAGVAAPIAGQNYTAVAPIALTVEAVPDATAVDPLSLTDLQVVIREGDASQNATDGIPSSITGS